jgi:hypothetical protein
MVWAGVRETPPERSCMVPVRYWPHFSPHSVREPLGTNRRCRVRRRTAGHLCFDRLERRSTRKPRARMAATRRGRVYRMARSGAGQRGPASGGVGGRGGEAPRIWFVLSVVFQTSMPQLPERAALTASAEATAVRRRLGEGGRAVLPERRRGQCDHLRCGRSWITLA